MKELVIVSGKGGTGKTSVVDSFAALVEGKVLADCDVDAADWHLVLAPTIISQEDFSGGSCTLIEPESCTACGKCQGLWPFEAISCNGRPMRSDLFDFATLAKDYDRWYKSPEGKMYDQAEKSAVLKFLRPAKPGDRLLDIGCGTGHWSRIFASRGYEVVGIDICSKMSEVARSQDYPGCYFEIADACRLPFDNASFEVVAAMATLEFVRAPEVTVIEMFRCVKPAGSVIVGSLNKLAPINRQRIATRKEPYASGRLFSPIQLRYMLAPYGRLRMTVSAENSRPKGMNALKKLSEKLPLWLRQPRGAFIVSQVRR